MSSMSSTSSTSSTSLVPSVPAAVPASAAHDVSARRLALAMTALVVTDAVGGVLAVVSGVNSWAEAWGPAALLAAPAPMVAGQVLLVVVAAGAIRRIDARWSAAAAVVLALACLVSVASGFVDGGLGNRVLGPGLVAYQAFLLAVTATVGLLAAWRGVVLCSHR